MARLSGSKTISWTHHARAKMHFYKLSEARVRRVLNYPKRIEEGVAPKTVAMMQPVSLRMTRKETGPSDTLHRYMGRSRRISLNPDLILKTGMKSGFKETWTQEIWVMVEDSRDRRAIISAWRYPGKTKPRSEISLAKMREEYQSFNAKRAENGKDEK